MTVFFGVIGDYIEMFREKKSLIGIFSQIISIIPILILRWCLKDSKIVAGSDSYVGEESQPRSK